MKREILFRGKDYDSGEWVYGTPVSAVGGEYSYIVNTSVSLNPLIIGTACIRIIHDTRGEFTGLTDKNGTRIFEGDIVKVKLPGSDKINIGVITYGKYDGYVSKEHIGFHLEGLKHTGIKGIGFYRDIEVIGNVYDNPDLIVG